MKLIFVVILAFLAQGCASKEPQDFLEDKALFEYASQLYAKRSYTDAIPFFESLYNRFPQSPHAIPSRLKIADAHFEKDDFLEAEIYYQSFRSLHPTHERIPYVVFRIGMCHFKQIPGGPDRDQSKTEHALQTFHEVLQRWPHSEYAQKASLLAEQCQRRLEERELYVVNFYFKQSQYEAAIGRLEHLTQQSQFPEFKTEALYKLGVAHSKLNQLDKAIPYLEQAATADSSKRFAKRAENLLKKLQAPK